MLWFTVGIIFDFLCAIIASTLSYRRLLLLAWSPFLCMKASGSKGVSEQVIHPWPAHKYPPFPHLVGARADLQDQRSETDAVSGALDGRIWDVGQEPSALFAWHIWKGGRKETFRNIHFALPLATHSTQRTVLVCHNLNGLSVPVHN